MTINSTDGPTDSLERRVQAVIGIVSVTLAGLTIGTIWFPWRCLGVHDAEGMYGAAYFFLLAPIALAAFGTLAVYSLVNRGALGTLRTIAGVLPGTVLCMFVGYWMVQEFVVWPLRLHATRFEIEAELRFQDGSESPTVQYFQWSKYKHLNESGEFSSVHFLKDREGPYTLRRTRGDDKLVLHFWNETEDVEPPVFFISVSDSGWVWSEWTDPLNATQLSPNHVQIRYRMRTRK